MSRNRDVKSPWWALRIGSNIGANLRKSVLGGRRESPSDWRNRHVRLRLRHRFLPGHGTRTTASGHHGHAVRRYGARGFRLI